MQNNPDDGIWLKFAMHFITILLGLGSKLVTLNKRRALTMKDYIFHAVVSAAMTWLTWWAIKTYHWDMYTVPLLFLSSRYSDKIMMALGDLVKKGITGLFEYMTKKF